MEGTLPPEAVGPPATPPDGDGFRGARSRRGLRFAGAVLVFLGILAAVGILTALIVFPDPMAVPQNELLRGWLIILGAVAATGVLLLAVAAPRAGYRWFDAALFLVPVYGQVIFAPRMLWLGSRSKVQPPRTEPPPGRPPEGPAAAAPIEERREPRDPERIREEVRTLAALLSGRGQIARPEATLAGGPVMGEPVVESGERTEETELSVRVAELRTEVSRMGEELELLRQEVRALRDQLRRGR